MKRTLLALALLTGCGDASMMMDIPPAPVNGYQFKLPDVPLNGGEEKYICYTLKLSEPADVAVKEFQSTTNQVVHHFEVFQTLLPEQDGMFECSLDGIKMTWVPLFGGGVATGGLKLPDGAGFKIPHNAQLLVQLHLLNASPTATPSQVAINMLYADDATKVVPAGIFALGTMNINLPAGAKGVPAGSSCAIPKQLNVFAVQPHMHKLGTKISFQHGADMASSQVIYKRDPWVFGAQPIDPFSLTINKGDYAATSCLFDNTTPDTVMYGESTKDEMCYFVLFYTPFDRLDGCID